jgi:hypothetical protein
VRDGDVIPAIADAQSQTILLDPAQLKALELQLLLHSALFEPVISLDDLVFVEHALEKVAA